MLGIYADSNQNEWALLPVWKRSRVINLLSSDWLVSLRDGAIKRPLVPVVGILDI